eukprot:83338-Ditylum_brightwellii.AAC.1
MEKENVKISPNCITRDVTVQKKITKENERSSVVTIMVCVTMTQRSATLCKSTESMFSPHMVSQNSRGPGRSGLSNRQRGQASQRVCQRQDQRDTKRAQLHCACNEQLQGPVHLLEQ